MAGAKAEEATTRIQEEDVGTGTTHMEVGLTVELAEVTLQPDQVAQIQIAMTAVLLVADHILSNIKVAIMLEASLTTTMAIRISITTKEIILEAEIREAMAAMETMAIMVAMAEVAIAIMVTTVGIIVLAVMVATVYTAEVQEATTPATRVISTSNKCNSIQAITTITTREIMTVNPRRSLPSSSHTHNQTLHNNIQIYSTAKILRAKGQLSPHHLPTTLHRTQEATRPRAASSHPAVALLERPCSNPPPSCLQLTSLQTPKVP